MPLRPNEFVTSANTTQSLYITREETIQAISSIVPLLSSFSTITFGVSPNPKFSTVSINTNGGLISGYAPIQTSNVIFAAQAPVLNAATQLRLGKVGALASASTNALCVADTNGNTAVMRAQRYIANVGGVGGYGAGWSFTNSGFVAIDANDNVTPVLTCPIGNTAAIALQNISTINGSPPNVNPTTYTNLSGNNITNSQVIGTPSIINLSSLNGLPISQIVNQNTWVPYTVTNLAAVSNTYIPNTPVQVIAFTNIPITAAVNRAVNISVPITVTPIGAVPADCRFTLIAYLGGGITGGSGVSQSIYFRAGSTAAVTITLAGTCIVNGNQNSLGISGLLEAAGNTGFSLQQGSVTFARFFFQQIV